MTGKTYLRNLNEVLRDEMVERERVAGVLRTGPHTIPEIATELSEPVDEVTKWVMGMRRYGRVHELPKDRSDDFYHYELAEVKA